MTTHDLSGVRVLILGGSGQLGRRIGRLAADAGASVALAGRDPSRLAEAASQISPTPPTLTFDLLDPATHDVIERAEYVLDGLDGVVNAAGAVAFGSLRDTPDEVIARLVAVDFTGPLALMRRAAPYLDGGFWVNISGVVAEQPVAGMAAYSGAKSALSAATRAAARELRRDGVTVIDVRPPHTETGLATRPISGVAPRLPEGLDPDSVAARIVQAIDAGEREVPAAAFA
jgi:NAD(P)-dependent dehydrogenase (short-subunit alcohol dehydrogenase family)